MGAHFEALGEGVLLVPFDPRYIEVGFNLVSVQVCTSITDENYRIISGIPFKADYSQDVVCPPMPWPLSELGITKGGGIPYSTQKPIGTTQLFHSLQFRIKTIIIPKK